MKIYHNAISYNKHNVYITQSFKDLALTAAGENVTVWF